MTRRSNPFVTPAVRPHLMAVAAVVAVVGLVVAACGGATASPSSSSAPRASVATASSGPSTPASPGPSAAQSPPAASQTIAPTSSASGSAAACAAEPQKGVLPSDRFTSVVISSGADADLVTFAFGAPSLPGPPAPPQGSLEAAVPPFTQAGSGLPIDLAGEHALAIRFTGMSIMNDTGQPVYDGPTEYRPDLPALRELALFDQSEGVIGWYLGYNGGGCVALTRVGDTVTVRIAHDRP